MTVGIASVCHSGKCVLMSADMRGTYRDPQFGAHEQIGKQYELPRGLLANIAGMNSLCHSISSQLYTEIDAVTDPVLLHDHVRNAMREAQFKEWLYRVDSEMLMSLGLRLAQWQSLDRITLQYRRANKLIKRHWLQMQMSVGGFDGHGFPILLTMHGNEPPEMQEFTTIGSGGDAALSTLIDRGQNVHQAFPRALVHVYEAMQAAKASDRHSGNCEALAILTPKQIRILPTTSRFLHDLCAQYAGRDTSPLDEDEKSADRLLADAFEPGLTKSEYRTGKREPDKPKQ
jgi:hypothetical protein